MSSQKPQHPLAARQLLFIRNWAEWKQLWTAATHVETLHGLLHVGFQVQLERYDDESIERLVLYLETADGHAEVDTFRSPLSGSRREGEYIHTPLAKGWPESTLQEVSRKAFTMLCKHVFKDDPKHQNEHTVPGVSYKPDWARSILRRDAMEKVLWFLRLDGDRHGRHQLSNDEGDYGPMAKNHRATYRAFAFDLARFILRWQWDDSGFDWRDALDEFKPPAVDILAGLGRLDILLHSDYRKTLDERCIARMTELALEAWIHAEDYRKVKSLAEAALAGSQAAKIVLLLEMLGKEQERLDEVSRLKRQAQDATNRLRELQQ